MLKRYFFLLLAMSLSLASFAQITLPVDFESPATDYTFEGFEGADSAIETNPDQSGENTSATVMRSTKTVGAQFFAGTVITLDAPIDFSTNQGISIKTWSPKVNIPIRVRLENADNSVGMEIDLRTKTASAWETLTADFGSRLTPGAQYTKIIIFFEFVNGLAGDGTTYYFDDIQSADVSGRTPVALPIDFEGADLFYDIAGFEGANANVIANPDASGDNTSATVMEYQKTNGSAFFAGVTVRFDTPIDFSTNRAISFSSWSPKANIPVRVQIEGSNPANIRQIDVNTTVANSWETLTADFSEVLVNGEAYSRIVIFYEFVVDLAGDGSVYYVDNIATADAGGGGGTVELPVDFESTELTYRFEGFEGAVSTIETNPDQSGENTSMRVMQTVKNPGQWFAGTFLDLDAPIDLSTDKGISITSWSPKVDIPVRIQLEDTANPANNRSVDVNTTVASQWETLTADFTNTAATGANYDRITIIFEAVVDLNGDGTTYYYDNITTTNVGNSGPPVSLPVDFENADLNYRFEGFEGADSAIETNPDQSGENTSATVMRTIKNEGQWFAGTFLDLDEPIDFSSDRGISISSWSPKADIPVRIQIEGPDGNVFVDVNTTVASQWETLTADFTGVATPGATYNRITVIFEAIEDLQGDGSTYYYDNLSTADVSGDSDPVTIPVGFENPNANYRFVGFEGADSSIETNPDQSGENTSATVMRTIKTDGAQFFAGTSVELDEPIDLSNTGKIVFSSWSPKAGIPVRIQLEDAANTEANRVFVDVNTVTASTWETLEADFSALQNPNADYVRIVIFYEFIVDLAGDGSTYYFDNLSVDELTSTRFLTAEEVQVFPNPTSTVWEVNSPEARIEVLDLFNMNGQRVLTASPNTNQYQINATELPTGTYVLHVLTAEGRRISRLVKQ